MTTKQFIGFYSLFCFIFMSIPTHAEYLFISSYPSGAEVFEIDNVSSNMHRLGKTPLKVDAKEIPIHIVYQKSGYQTVTNRVNIGVPVQNDIAILKPLSFQLQFPEERGNFYLNGKQQSPNLDNSWILPYGNYDFSYDKKLQALKANYKSPYIPYLVFFTSISLISIILMGVGYGLGAQAVASANSSANQTDLLANLSVATQLEAVALSGVGLGAVGLSGTLITGALEGRELQRRRRFELQNSPAFTSRYLSEYQSIILSGKNNPRTLTLIQSFLDRYDEIEFSLAMNLYLLRAEIYRDQGRSNLAIRDLKTVFDKYPTIESYGTSSSLLAQIYADQKEYADAIYYYNEAIKVNDGTLKVKLYFEYLSVLVSAAKENPDDYLNEFILKSQTELKFTPEQKNQIEQWNIEFQEQ